MKRRAPQHDIVVLERNSPDDTFGWGVVFSDQTMDNLRANDANTAEEIADSFAHWDVIDVHFKDTVVSSGGHGFSGIGRQRLLHILQERARALGVSLEFEHEVEDFRAFADADLVVAADGVNSRVRQAGARHFKPDIDVRGNKFVWLATRRVFDAFTFVFKETAYGWIQAHAYSYDLDTSTFIVECPEVVWRGLGVDRMAAADGIRLCEDLFAEHLCGHELMSNAPHLADPWLNFQRISNERWFHGNTVLIGDAAHTAHFSIGSGTKLALEDAIALANKLADHGQLAEAFAAYEDERGVEVLRLQSAARNSTEWFESVGRYSTFEPTQFAYSLLTRSQRVSHENLRLRDQGWLEGVEAWLGGQASGRARQSPVPPMFLPFSLRSMELDNRVVVSPMAMYSAADGVPGDLQLVHLGARAQGGAGLVFTDNDVRHRRRPNYAGLCRHVRRGPRRRMAPDRRLRAQANTGQDRPSARALRSQRLDQARLGGDGRAARCRQLAGDGPLGGAVVAGASSAAGDDPRRYGDCPRRLRHGDRDGRALWL